MQENYYFYQIIIVTGEAGKFNIIPLFLTVGAGLGLLSISAMLADCFMANFSEKRKLYRNLTVFEIKPEEEEKFNKLKKKMKTMFNFTVLIFF